MAVRSGVAGSVLGTPFGARAGHPSVRSPVAHDEADGASVAERPGPDGGPTDPRPDGTDARSDAAAGADPSPTSGGEATAADRASGAATPAPPPTAKGAPFTQQVGRVIVIAAAVLFGIFAVFNAQHVDFNWVFGSSEVVETGGQRTSGGIRLILLLCGAFALGLLVGYFGAYRGVRTRVETRMAKKAAKG